MRVEIYKDAAGEYRWRAVHDNGNVMADSGEGYARLVDLQSALATIAKELIRAIRDTISEEDT